MNTQYKGPLDYIDVATRIVEFRGKFPQGSLQQVRYEILTVGERTFITYTAAAYRTPDDARPGIGTAWEPVPGPTSFTRDSEMQNAETAAWGRAIVAVLAADTKRGIASAEEVRNRSQEPAPEQAEKPTRRMGLAVTQAQLSKMHACFNDLGITDREKRLEYANRVLSRDKDQAVTSSKELTKAEAAKLIDALESTSHAEPDETP
jgi:hypothetical protein